MRFHKSWLFKNCFIFCKNINHLYYLIIVRKLITMNIINLKESHIEQPPSSNVGISSGILLLPSISTQACPITAARENSSLTKRMSYSDHLKERSIQSPNSSLYVAEEPFLENSENFNKQWNSKGERVVSDSSSTNSILQQNSLKECHQILSRIQKKLSNKSVKKSSSVINKSSNESKSWCIFSQSRKHHKLSAASLLRNDLRKKNSTKRKKSMSCLVDFKNEKLENGTRIVRNKEIENIYVGTSKGGDSMKKRSDKTIYKLTMIKQEKDLVQKLMQPNDTPISKSAVTEKDIDHVNKQFADVLLQKSLTKDKNRLKNVYYSERQSVMVDDIPGVPPCTPNERLVNAIASLSDVKSQRCIQQKLQGIKCKQKKKEKEIIEAAKAKELHRKLVKRKELMDTQRRQIYAVNRILADIEYENFLKFKNETQGVPI